MKRSLILLSTLSVALCSATFSASAQSGDQRHLLYLPDNDARVEHAAIIRAFENEGFVVETHAYTNADRLMYARDIRDRIRGLMREGVAPENISVLGAGWGSDLALLTSAVTGNRRVNYVVLGGCSQELKGHMRLAGNVMALRDVAEAGSRSCRPLFTGAPRLSARKDLKLATSYGQTLFDTARMEWTKPVVEWMHQGKVDVGEANIAMGQP